MKSLSFSLSFFAFLGSDIFFGLGASYFFSDLADKVNFPASWTRLDRSGTPWSYRKFEKTITSLWAYVNI